MSQDELSVQTDELLSTAASFISRADDATRSFENHYTALTSAADGLFSRSSRVLRTRAESWRQQGTAVASAVGESGATMRTAAWAFDQTDQAEATHISVYRTNERLGPDRDLRL